MPSRLLYHRWLHFKACSGNKRWPYKHATSEAGSSGGQPLTVLVFHDGNKVHMYTLMESGDCVVSPLSGTVSETSSISSVKNVEELDDKIAEENEITREKLVKIQEQLRALNLNRARKTSNVAHIHHSPLHSNAAAKNLSEDFHLPPIQRVGAIDSQPLYSHKNPHVNKIQKIPNSFTGSFVEANKVQSNQKSKCPHKHASSNSDCGPAALDFITNKISTCIMASPVNSPTDLSNQACSSFLPYLAQTQSLQNNLSSIPSTTSQVLAVKLNSSLDSVIKHDVSSTKRTHCRTSNQALSAQRFFDLDDWLQHRPKTSPLKSSETAHAEEAMSKHKLKEDRRKRRLKDGVKVTMPIRSVSDRKSSLVVQMMNDYQDVPLDLTKSVNIQNSPCDCNNSLNSIEAGFKDRRSPPEDSIVQEVFSVLSSVKKLPSRPQSVKKLPLIKTKRKSQKRCSLCSKKTGLATSYTCRCGKNFCASHRYAETHHCSYDYKTEGRRLLQLNNPVITASKLPKI